MLGRWVVVAFVAAVAMACGRGKAVAAGLWVAAPLVLVGATAAGAQSADAQYERDLAAHHTAQGVCAGKLQEAVFTTFVQFTNCMNATEQALRKYSFPDLVDRQAADLLAIAAQYDAGAIDSDELGRQINSELAAIEAEDMRRRDAAHPTVTYDVPAPAAHCTSTVTGNLVSTTCS